MAPSRRPATPCRSQRLGALNARGRADARVTKSSKPSELSKTSAGKSHHHKSKEVKLVEAQRTSYASLSLELRQQIIGQVIYDAYIAARVVYARPGLVPQVRRNESIRLLMQTLRNLEAIFGVTTFTRGTKELKEELTSTIMAMEEQYKATQEEPLTEQEQESLNGPRWFKRGIWPKSMSQRVAIIKSHRWTQTQSLHLSFARHVREKLAEASTS